MATTDETVPDSGPADAAAADTAERLANAAGEAADTAGEALKLEGGEFGTQGDAWSFWFRALMTVVVVVVCYVATKVSPNAPMLDLIESVFLGASSMQWKVR